MPMSKLQSSDGKVFPGDVEIARLSVTIRTMLEDLGIEDEVEKMSRGGSGNSDKRQSGGKKARRVRRRAGVCGSPALPK